VDKIDIDQDLEFQNKEWHAERLGWIIGLALLLAGLAGLFGKGPLSYAARQDGPLRITWERICRYNSSIDLQVDLDPGQANGEQVLIWLDQAYIEQFEIETITPTPQNMHVDGKRMLVEFQAPPAGAPFHATFQIRPQRAGVLNGALGDANSSRQVRFEQLIYP
jgi:hypothetical protein